MKFDKSPVPSRAACLLKTYVQSNQATTLVKEPAAQKNGASLALQAVCGSLPKANGRHCVTAPPSIRHAPAWPLSVFVALSCSRTPPPRGE